MNKSALLTLLSLSLIKVSKLPLSEAIFFQLHLRRKMKYGSMISVVALFRSFSVTFVQGNFRNSLIFSGPHRAFSCSGGPYMAWVQTELVPRGPDQAEAQLETTHHGFEFVTTHPQHACGCPFSCPLTVAMFMRKLIS